MNDSSRHGANLATSGNPMAASIASSANRPGGLPLVLHYVLVMLVSALLHVGAWQLRNLLNLHPETLPKPKPPIEVTLVPAPKPVAEALATAAPGAITSTESAKPVSMPVIPPPKPVTKPAEIKMPPALKPAPPKPPRPIEARPKPARRTKPVDEPDPNLPREPPEPPRPRWRESEPDPNLPPLVRPVEREREPALPKPAPKPRPLPRPRDEDDPNLPPAAPPLPRDTAVTRESVRNPAPPGRPAASTVPLTGPAPVTARDKIEPATGGKPGGPFEGAKANAAYLHNPKPEYPPLARRRQWEGRVILRVRVLAAGTVAEASVETSSGHEVLDEAALEAVRNWHFVPARRGGQAVDSLVNVPINFNLLDSQ